jgi:hypothetical protein
MVASVLVATWLQFTAVIDGAKGKSGPHQCTTSRLELAIRNNKVDLLLIC